MTAAIPNPAARQNDINADAAAARLAGESLLERIGNTPLLRLDTLTRHLPTVQLLGKAEWYNPGGSVKGRTAASIVTDARRSGKLATGKILLDSTSGNTGIAYAMLGAALGFPVTLCIPENVSIERKRILQAYGANIIFTDPGEGSDGASRIAHELAEKHPDHVGGPRPTTPIGAHYRQPPTNQGTSEGRVTHFVSIMERLNFCRDTPFERTESADSLHFLEPDSPFHGIEGTTSWLTLVPALRCVARGQRSESARKMRTMARRLARERLAGWRIVRAAVVGCLGVRTP